VVQFEKNIETTIHEIIHALGFVDSLFDMYYDSSSFSDYKNPVIIKDGILKLATPRVKAYA
jgi:hypothetical protein